MSRRFTNKYGMPKNSVRSERPPHATAVTVSFLRLRDDLEALQLDALDAFHAGLISGREYSNEISRLKSAVWKAEGEYQRANRAAHKQRELTARSRRS